jgi:hypothetical protein
MASAVDGMGTIAAPLLAAASVALIVVVLSSTSAFRWANASLVALVLATAAFIAATEFVFMARQYAVTPEALEAWWPDASATLRRKMLRSEQRYYLGRFNLWASRARLAYNVAILAFSAGVTLLLVPKAWGHASDGRLAVFALAALGFGIELLWIAGTLKRPKIVLPEVGDEVSLEAN